MKLPVDVLCSISSYLSYNDAKHYKLVPDWEKVAKRQLLRQYDDFLGTLETEMTAIRENKRGHVSIKTWRKLLKQAKRIRSNSDCVIAKRIRSNLDRVMAKFVDMVNM